MNKYISGGAVITIWVEYVILDNLVINMLLLWFVFRTIKQKTPWVRVFAAAAAGTAFALILPVLSFSGAALFAVKLFVGAGLVFIVQNRSFARWLLFYMLFLTYTFAFGGAIYGIAFMFEGTQNSLLFFKTNSDVPVGVLILGGVIFGKIMSLLIKFLNMRHSVNNYLRDVVIHYEKERFKITSYLDTGNKLVDPVSQAPVVIISVSLFMKMFPDVEVDRILLNKLSNEGINDGRYINFSTVDKRAGSMFIFAPNKIDIADGAAVRSCENVRLGVSMRSFRDVVKYDALLNASLA